MLGCTPQHVVLTDSTTICMLAPQSSCQLVCLLRLGVCLQRLHAVKGLSEAKADKMVEAAKKLTNVGSWITGMEAMQKVRARFARQPDILRSTYHLLSQCNRAIQLLLSTRATC